MAWSAAEHDAIVKMLAVACELTQTQWSEAAQAIVLRQLGSYGAKEIVGGLERCASECKFKLTLADIVSRLDDGRPGAEEAWALMPKDEADAGVVTQEMSAAWGIALMLIDADPIAARMAFKESYEREVRQARQQAIPATWRLSPGHNHELTQSVACEAVRAGKLPAAAIEPYVLPENRPSPVKALPAPTALFGAKQLEANKARLAAVLARIAGEVPAPTGGPAHWTEEKERES